MPLRKRFSKSLTYISLCLRNLPCFNGSVIHVSGREHEIDFTLSLIIDANPKNHPIEHLFQMSYESRFFVAHTHKGVESTKLMPVKFPAVLF